MGGLTPQARFKCRILHAPNLIAELTACKMRRLNQHDGTQGASTGSTAEKW